MSQQPDSIAKIIHKKKEAKKKQKVKGLSSVGQLSNRTIGEGSTQQSNTQMSKVTEVEGQQYNREQSASRTRNQIINIQIDELLFNWCCEGLISEDYMAYYAKACHTLGLDYVNRLAINSRTGRNPQGLFAVKVKGAMSLHFKRKFYEEQA